MHSNRISSFAIIYEVLIMAVRQIAKHLGFFSMLSMAALPVFGCVSQVYWGRTTVTE
jgi:hypothetical protein